MGMDAIFFKAARTSPRVRYAMPRVGAAYRQKDGARWADINCSRTGHIISAIMIWDA